MAVETLIDVLHDAVSVTHKGYTFLNNRLDPTEWSFNDIAIEAKRRGRYFRSLGLQQGDRLAIIIPDGEDFVLSFLGAVSVGIVPVPMYPPLALGRIDSYLDGAKRIMATGGARMILTTKQVSPILWSLTTKVDSLEGLILAEKMRDNRNEDFSEYEEEITIKPEDPCFLQFTSGSTSDPKGVVVTHGSLVANSHAIMYDGLHCDPETDKGISWLPLYHDMGLIGFVIAPLLAKVPVVFIPTMSFVKRPSLWMKVVNEYRGTITFAPNFAFGLAAKRARNLEGLDLSCLRVLGCGAEPINPKTMRNFVNAFTPAGFNPNALMPCYGMAEATLAIAFDTLKEPFSTVVIDRDTYEEDRVAKPFEGEEGSDAAMELVSCGRSFSRHEVAVVDETGKHLSEGEVGEILFKGPSVSAGYFENEEASNELLEGGWLHTGDLGFVKDGEVFISGRKKDLIILNGRNYYPQSIEWIVERINGIRKGNVVAFSTWGANSEDLIVVAETKEEDRDTLGKVVRRHVKTTLGLNARQVVILGPGELPKTSSGKLQRRKTKAQFEAGTLGKESRAMGSTATKITLARHLTMSAVAKIRHSIKGALTTNNNPPPRRANSR